MIYILIQRYFILSNIIVCLTETPHEFLCCRGEGGLKREGGLKQFRSLRGGGLIREGAYLRRPLNGGFAVTIFLLFHFLRQCTECDSSSSEDEDSKIDPNDNTSLLESRQKRNIKEPSKFTPGKDVSIRNER